MQSALGTYQPSTAGAKTSVALPFDRATHTAVVALSRSLELHDAALARRAALRAAVVSHVAEALMLDVAQHATALGGALLSDVAALITHTRPTNGSEATSAVLGASLLDRVTSGGALADAVRHQCERWDGEGAPGAYVGESIPLAARVIAVVSELVGPVEAGGTPHWAARSGRVRSLAGSVLDPEVARTVVDRIALASPAAAFVSIDHALAMLETLVVGVSDESPIESLTSIGAAIHASDRVDEVLSLIAGYVRRAIGANTVGIAKDDFADRLLRVVTEVGDLAAATAGPDTTYPVDMFPATSAFRSSDAHAYTRTDLDPSSTEATYLGTVGAQSEIAVPLDIESHRWGVLWARTAAGGGELGDGDLATMRLAASQITTSIAHASRVADLEALAMRDPLTGLGNRRVLETTLRRIFARPPVARQDCAVIICDVDGLKLVNDTEGHAAGDTVLVDAASALRHAVSEVVGATVCRIGGDEFCIVLDGGGMLFSEPVASRAQKLFARSGAGRSMSCGVAVSSIGVNAPGELLRAADEAQYLQKRGRRGTTDDDLLDLGGRGGRRARRDR